MTLIDKLTPEQVTQLDIYRKHWTDIGLRPLAERHLPTYEELVEIIGCVYDAGGIPRPKTVIPVGSLMSIASLISNSALDRNLIKNSVGNSVGDSVWNLVRDSVGNSVRNSVRNSVWNSVGDSVWDSDINLAKILISNSVSGCYDAGWCAWAAYMNEQLGISGTEKSKGLRGLANVAGFSYFGRDIAIVSAPHVILHQNEKNELHCEDGPAIVYLDGYAIWALNGYCVPRWIIESPDHITIQTIHDEENVEIRRLMIERYPGGTGAYLTASGAKVLDTDSLSTDTCDLNAPHLMRALITTNDGDRYLVGTDGSTRRTYYMLVPDDVTTCSEAHASITPFDITDNKIISNS
jgi:hypothetical protein